VVNQPRTPLGNKGERMGAIKDMVIDKEDRKRRIKDLEYF
jgi:hypothetical protein